MLHHKGADEFALLSPRCSKVSCHWCPFVPPKVQELAPLGLTWLCTLVLDRSTSWGPFRETLRNPRSPNHAGSLAGTDQFHPPLFTHRHLRLLGRWRLHQVCFLLSSLQFGRASNHRRRHLKTNLVLHHHLALRHSQPTHRQYSLHQLLPPA